MNEFRLNLLQVLGDGSLPRGYYWYRVVAILPDCELDLANTLRVYAPFRGNSIGLFWDEVPGAETYRVIRRRDDEEEGSILVSSPAFFHDTGIQEFG